MEVYPCHEWNKESNGSKTIVWRDSLTERELWVLFCFFLRCREDEEEDVECPTRTSPCQSEAFNQCPRWGVGLRQREASVTVQCPSTLRRTSTWETYPDHIILDNFLNKGQPFLLED